MQPWVGLVEAVLLCGHHNNSRWSRVKETGTRWRQEATMLGAGARVASIERDLTSLTRGPPRAIVYDIPQVLSVAPRV